MKQIICVGNRHRLQDATGPLVHDRLLRCALPPGIELIDGGLGGPDRLPSVDEAERIVFVKAVGGFCQPGGVVVLRLGEARQIGWTARDDSTGLTGLLDDLERMSTGRTPEILVLGVEGPPDVAAVEMAADLALNLANRGSLFGAPAGSSFVNKGERRTP